MVSTMFNETEWVVARSLLQLSRMPFTWGCRKRRSSTHYLSSLPMQLHHGDAVAVVKRETSILATPLFFESKEKPKSLQIKFSCKRKREDYVNVIEDLTKTKAKLNQEIDTVKCYYDQLKTFNLKLKTRKERKPSSSSDARGNVNYPLVIHDMNLSREELIQVDSYQPLDWTIANRDLSRAKAAQARRRRIQILRLKNSIRNNKPRSSCES